MMTIALSFVSPQDPQKTIDFIREKRPGSIQTWVQQRFIFEFAELVSEVRKVYGSPLASTKSITLSLTDHISSPLDRHKSSAFEDDTKNVSRRMSTSDLPNINTAMIHESNPNPSNPPNQTTQPSLHSSIDPFIHSAISCKYGYG